MPSAPACSPHCPTRSVPAAPVFASAPAIGTATAGNAQVTLSWTAPAAVANAAVTQYRVRVFVGACCHADPRSYRRQRRRTQSSPDLSTAPATRSMSRRSTRRVRAGLRHVAPLTTPRTEFVAPDDHRQDARLGRQVRQPDGKHHGDFQRTGSERERWNGCSPAQRQRCSDSRLSHIQQRHEDCDGNPNATLLADRTYNIAFPSIRDTAGNSLASIRLAVHHRAGSHRGRGDACEPCSGCTADGKRDRQVQRTDCQRPRRGRSS